MPVYARRCSDCNHTFEAFASMAESENIPCSACGARTGVDWLNMPAPAVPKEKLVGSRCDIWERGCPPHEVPEVRQLFAGTGVDVTDDGYIRAPDKTSARKFFQREQDIKRQSREKNEQLTSGKIG